LSSTVLITVVFLVACYVSPESYLFIDQLMQQSVFLHLLAPWAQFCCKMWGGQVGVKPIY